jgi:hypothetical protein
MASAEYANLTDAPGVLMIGYVYMSMILKTIVK